MGEPDTVHLSGNAPGELALGHRNLPGIAPAVSVFKCRQLQDKAEVLAN